MEQFTKAELFIIAHVLMAVNTKDSVSVARIAIKAARMADSAPVSTITPEGEGLGSPDNTRHITPKPGAPFTRDELEDIIRGLGSLGMERELSLTFMDNIRFMHLYWRAREVFSSTPEEKRVQPDNKGTVSSAPSGRMSQQQIEQELSREWMDKVFGKPKDE